MRNIARIFFRVTGGIFFLAQRIFSPPPKRSWGAAPYILLAPKGAASPYKNPRGGHPRTFVRKGAALALICTTKELYGAVDWSNEAIGAAKLRPRIDIYIIIILSHSNIIIHQIGSVCLVFLKKIKEEFCIPLKYKK